MMNLKLKEWNEACDYAKETCKKLKAEGYEVRFRPYSMHDGRRGAKLQVFDNMDNFFTEYMTGIHTNLDDIKKSIDKLESRIIKEV
jgi:hypothetical protein